MFERFSDSARKAVVLAQAEALGLNHLRLGTEHLLLGVIAEQQGIGSESAAACGITLEAARGQVLKIIGAGSAPQAGAPPTGAPPTVHVPFTPNAKKAFEGSVSIAMAHGHQRIGSGQVLLGLLDLEGSGARQVLDGLGVSPQTLRDEVLARLTAPGSGDEPLT